MTAPPSSALSLLREGHTVARVIEWTGCSRYPLQLLLHRYGMYIDRRTDTAREIPVPQTGPPWRVWARSNGWPDLPDAGKLPTGLMPAYRAANEANKAAVRRARNHKGVA